MTSIRVAVCQLRSTQDVVANLEAASRQIAVGVSMGADLVTLPESFGYLRREGEPVKAAQDREGPILCEIRQQARRHAVWILAGSYPERIPGDSRVHNTSVLVDPNGEIAAEYRKIHLFDVDLEGAGGGRFHESARTQPGDEVVVADTPFGGVGLSICYDLRFPELYREHARRGARFLCVPSAFAPATGRDHWEVLLRARAIENQAFVIAPAQWGDHAPNRSSYGRSLVVDPWGVVLATVGDREGVATADCDLAAQDQLREALPALTHRRL